jgi:alkaline phosphatase D
VPQAGEQYFYRFYTCDENSRWAASGPRAGRLAEPVRIGFFSARPTRRASTPPTRLAQEPDLDIVVCLGDYIYEKPFYERGIRQDRTGPNRDGDVQSLAEYREKYALYHSDPRLLELRRQFR